MPDATTQPAMESTDLFAHANPAFVASVVRWLSEGFAEQRRKDGRFGETGCFPLWALAGVALVGTDSTLVTLPQTARRRLTNLFFENPDWRTALATSITAWAPAFWRGVGFAYSRKMVTLTNGAVRPSGPMTAPTNEWERVIREKAITLGRVLGRETDVTILSTVFGLNTRNMR